MIADQFALLHAGTMLQVPILLDKPLANQVPKAFERHAKHLEDLGD